MPMCRRLSPSKNWLEKSSGSKRSVTHAALIESNGSLNAWPNVVPASVQHVAAATTARAVALVMSFICKSSQRKVTGQSSRLTEAWMWHELS
jgi:hypothetical protein